MTLTSRTPLGTTALLGARGMMTGGTFAARSALPGFRR